VAAIIGNQKWFLQPKKTLLGYTLSIALIDVAADRCYVSARFKQIGPSKWS
jgi:hypothetical protein